MVCLRVGRRATAHFSSFHFHFHFLFQFVLRTLLVRDVILVDPHVLVFIIIIASWCTFYMFSLVPCLAA
ncbi:hypothetical protein EDD21DRAFT_390662, partial [Dissophora ornata]